MKKYIIFDFDGTLVDVLPTVEKIFKKLIKDYGYGNISTKEIDSLRSMNALEIIKEMKFPIWKIPKISKDVRDELAKQIQNTKPFIGIEQMLVKLKNKGLKLAIITLNKKRTVEHFLKINNFNYFDEIVGCHGIFNKSRYLLRFLRKNNLQNKDAIYIGDEVRDIEAAQDANIDVISVTWGFNKKNILIENNPTYIVDSPSEIPKLLDKTS